MRKPVVGVMGGSKATAEVAEMARRLGTLIAQNGWVLLNGGRDCGVMAASAAGMGDARNVINVMSSDGVIACPGALGTWSEIVLALKRDKHVVLLGFEAGPDLTRHAKRGQLSHADTPEEAVEQVTAVLDALGR